MILSRAAAPGMFAFGFLGKGRRRDAGNVQIRDTALTIRRWHVA